MSSNLSVKKVSPEVMRSPRLKAERADKHINELLARTQALPAEWFDLSVKRTLIPPHTQPTQFYLAYTPLKPVPELLALIIGDAIHNLRAALDHLATGICRTVDEGAKPYFPVTKDRKNLEGSGSLAQMEAALPGSKELVLNKIRPINNAKDRLWAFSSVDIDDKHNLVIPTVTVASFNFGGNIGGNIFENFGVGNDAAKPFIAIRSDIPFAVQGDPKMTVDVAFGPGTPFDGEPVLPTLMDIRQVVSETLGAFERLICA